MGGPGIQPHTRLGRYELLARLATGGMGEIFLARLEGAEGFEKLFVVKRILPHLADDERFREMLISEARIASRLSHANICQVYELGDEAGQLYIVMEYLDGVSLLPLLRKASKAGMPLDFGFVSGVILQTCDALHYAHELRDRSGESMGLVHRDVTPANIFLTESGVAKLLDFGIAKAKGASANTQTGAVKGKYAYMAPEQLRGGEIDRRVDVFALGVVLYEMLALRRLFQRTTDYLTFRAVMEQPIPDVRRYRADVPDALACAVSRALDRSPSNRFDSARQLASAVLDAVGEAQIRPWTQGQIGDYVHTTFVSDLERRSHQVSLAIGAPARAPTSSGRTTMPLLVHPDDDTRETDDGGDDFPSVDTEVGDPPTAVLRGPVSAEFQTTPPPFASPGDSTTSGQVLQSLQPVVLTSPPPPMLVAQRRSVVWPLVAGAMVVIAAGALALVYKQSTQLPPQVVINSSPRGPDVVPGPTPTPGSAIAAVPPGSDASAGSAGSGSGTHLQTRPHPHPVDPRTSYDAVFNANLGAMNQCMLDHPESGAPESAKVHISTDGHTKSVALHPDGINGSPLGACIRNVLSVAKWPTAANETDATVPFKPKSI